MSITPIRSARQNAPPSRRKKPAVVPAPPTPTLTTKPANDATGAVLVDKNDLLEALTGMGLREQPAAVYIIENAANELDAIAELADAGGTLIDAGVDVDMNYRLANRLRASAKILTALAAKNGGAV